MSGAARCSARMAIMNIVMISLDSALMDTGSAAYARHRALAALAGRLTILVRVKTAHLQPIVDESLIVIPVVAARVWHVLPRVWAAARALHESFDLIVTQDMFVSGLAGVLLKRWMGARLLVQSHSTIFDNAAWVSERPFIRRALLVLAAWVVRRADAVRTVNDHEKNALTRRGFAADRIHVLALGTASQAFVNPPPEDVAAMRRELDVRADQPVLLWIGYPVAFKRVELLPVIFRHVKTACDTARLVLIGLNDAQIAALRAEMPDGVSAHPPIPPARVPLAFACADVYVLTSRYEGLPRVLFEAGAAGIPAVGFDVPGVRDVIENGVTGYTVADGDLHAFAARVIDLLHEPARAKTMGEAAQIIALRLYNADEYPAKWVAVWADVIGRSS